MYPDHFLDQKLQARIEANALRTLVHLPNKIDFCSNDYLGIARRKMLHQSETNLSTGSTGSRLLAGHTPYMNEVEQVIATFHAAVTALLFNSGYDANVGLLSSVPQKGDTILYDYLSHASIRDGIRLSMAQSFSFNHNDLEDLKKKIQKASGQCFIVTESVFSMDGDFCPLQDIVTLAKEFNAHIIIDEAHATGVVGAQGAGWVQACRLEKEIFARIHTFGKACGCHGAVVLGSERLRSYLINFARSLMYSTSLPESAIHAIHKSYELFPTMDIERNHLRILVNQFQQAKIRFNKLVSDTAIQGVIVPGNSEVRALANMLQQEGFDIRPVLYPTVPAGAERLRIVLHAFNSEEELQRLISKLQ